MSEERPQLLIIDDELLYTEVLSLICERRGFDVIGVLTAEEGLAQAVAAQPNVILLDLSMPQMSGWQVLEQLKGDKRTAHIPVILISGRPVDSSDPQRLQAAAAAILTKPCPPDLLFATLNRVLGDEPGADLATP